MAKIKLSIFLVLLVVIASCSPKSGASKTKTGSFSEDLSAYRPTFEALENEEGADIPKEESKPDYKKIKPENDITQQINSALENQEVRNSENKLVQGYTIQVYSGNNREDANEARSLVYKIFPDARPETTYVQPNYKVKVGKYLSRMEAQKLYSRLKADFPGALVIPEKIKLSQY